MMGKGTYDNQAANTANPDGYSQEKFGPAPAYNPPPHGYNYQQAGGPPTSDAIQMQPASGAPYNAANSVNVYSTPGVPQQTIVIQQEPRYSMVGHIIFSCVVFWCCNCLFGAIAFFVAMSGQNQPMQEARKKGQISMILNIVGIVVSFIMIAVILGLYFGLGMWQTTYYYNYGYTGR